MANVKVFASFMLSTGEVVDMNNDAMAEGTETELQVSTDYSVSAVSLGQYADGKVITQILQPVQGANNISYAYIDRRGEILCILPVAVAGVISTPSAPLWSGALQAGDTVRVMVNTASDREFGYSVITNTGVHAIFTGTPTGAGNTDLTHIKSSQGLGASLTGQRVVKHFATSIDGVKIDSGGGVYLLNDRGLPVGGCVATNPINLQPDVNQFGQATINLNYVARVTCNA